MAEYAKTEWKDHIVNPGTGEIIQQGTRFTAQRANNIEEGVASAHKRISDQELEIANEIEVVKEAVTTHEADDTAHGIGDKTELMTSNKATLVGAVNELFTNVSNGKNLVGGAITDVDPNVAIPADPTFQQLVNAIGEISTGVKKAKGNISTPSNGVMTVTGLLFRPTTIITFNTNYVGIWSLEAGFNTTWYVASVYYATSPVQTYNRTDGKSNVKINDSGFTIAAYGPALMNWIAFE